MRPHPTQDTPSFASWQQTVAYYGMQPHPEGGYWAPVYRQEPQYSSILFLLPAGEFSAFHWLDCDEIWYLHAGTLRVHQILPDGSCRSEVLSMEGALQCSMKQGTHFAAEPMEGAPFVLLSCLCVPAFREAGFHLSTQEALQTLSPQCETLIRRLIRPESPSRK